MTLIKINKLAGNEYSLLILISALFFIFYLSTIPEKSATYDEPIIIASGNHFLRTFDNSINSENPPFLKSLLALPTIFMNLNLPVNNQKTRFEYGTQNSFKFGNEFLFKNDFKKILLLSRNINIIITLVFAFFVFQTSKLFFKNNIYNYLAFSLFLLSPNIIANGRLATLDTGIAMLMFAVNFFFLKYYFTEKNKFLFFLSLFLSLALLSKFTAVLLLPILIFQFILLFLDKKNFNLKIILTVILILFIIPCLIIILFYCGNNLSLVLFNRDFKSAMLETLVNNFFFKNIPILLPEQYLRGFDIVSYINSSHGDKFTFLGGTYTHGIWYYYIILSSLKIPIPIIILSITGFYIISKKYYKNFILYILLMPCIFILTCFSFLTVRQLGFRYILLIIPCLILVSVYSINYFCANKSKFLKLFTILLIVFLIYEDISVYPDYLTYFNELIGNSRNAYKYFDDSNLDWGQDLPSIKKWTNQKGNPGIYLSYFGQTPIELYGLKKTLNNPEYIIISATNLNTLKLYFNFYRNLFISKPFDIINNSVLVYKISDVQNLHKETKYLFQNENNKTRHNDNSSKKSASNLKWRNQEKRQKHNSEKNINISCDEKYYIEIK